VTNSDIIELALEYGFAKLFFARPYECCEGDTKLVHNPFEKYAWAKTVVLLLMPCALSDYSDDIQDGIISSYYIQSQKAYLAAKSIADRLTEAGYCAVSNVQIPIKPYLYKHSECVRGLNSLLYEKELGSAFHVQTIVTDCAFDISSPVSRTEAQCLSCGRCVEACPTRAIRPQGGVESETCLRHISEQSPIPQKYEALLGNHLLGCEVCQNVCPMNDMVERQKPYVYPLTKLLSGEIEPLKQSIGTNVARKLKMQLKACTLAANLNRTDLIPELEALSKSDDLTVAASALHALDRLK